MNDGKIKSNLRLALLARAGKTNPYLAHRDDRARTAEKPEKDADKLKREPRPKTRASKPLRFVPRGKYINIANKKRQEQEIEHLKKLIDVEVKEAGMEMDLISLEAVPTRALDSLVEWWDAPLFDSARLAAIKSINTETVADMLNLDPYAGSLVTQYVQVPHKMDKVSSEKNLVKDKEVVLTLEERRKLRKQRRTLAQQDKQDMQRLGLLPQDEPKLRIGNVLRVLGSQSTLDPTQVEAMARRQTEERRLKGEEHNLSRKLTAEQRSEKLAKKYKLPEGVEAVRIAVFRIQSLTDQRKRFKIRANAVQLHMTGVAAVYRDFTTVVVEGSIKSVEFYKKLLLRRIDWSSETLSTMFPPCVLVWEGESSFPHFNDFSLRVCGELSKAESIFAGANCIEYFRLCENFNPDI